MENSEDNKNFDLEEFLANLVLPSCTIHPKLQTEFICFERDCHLNSTPHCSFCFKKLHENKKHIKHEIRNLLEFMLQNETKILSKGEILKSIPFFNEIPDKLAKIEKKIEDLQNYKKKLMETKEEINKRMDNYLPNKNNLKKILVGNCINNELFLKLLPLLLNTIENKDENNEDLEKWEFKKTEFSDSEIKKFVDFFELDPINCSNEQNAHILYSPVQNQISITIISKNEGEIKAFYFNEENIADGVALLKNNTIVKREDYSSQEKRFCLIAPTLTASSKITLRINKLANWIAIGMVLVKCITNNNLKFVYTNQIHERGYYVISHNGYTWSDYDHFQHHQSSNFIFQTGSILEIDYNAKEKVLDFKNRIDQKQKRLNLSEYKDDNFAFAVALLGPGDEIEILEN